MPRLTTAQRLQESLTREQVKRQELERALKREQAARSGAVEQQTATSEILRVISSSPTDLTPVFTTIVANATRLCEAQLGNLFSYDGDAFHAVAHHNASPPFVDILRGPLHPGPETGLHQWLSDPRPFQIADVRLTRPYEESEPYAVVGADLEGIRTLLGVPLVKENRPVGVITIYRREVRPFTDKQIDLVKTFADQAVIAIENVRLFNETKEALDQQTATSEILRTIAHSQIDAQPVFDTIVRSAARLCNAATAAVFLTDGRTLYHPANYGSSPEALAAVRAHYPRPLDMDTTPGIAILTRSVVRVSDIEDPSAGELVRRAGRLLGFRSVVAVPMLREGESVGAIIVTRQEPGRFPDSDVDLLKTFADQAVIAVENVRLFTELREKNRALTEAHAQVTEALEQQTATSEILSIISSSPTDVQPVFDVIASSALRLCDGVASFVFRHDGTLIHLAAFDSAEGVDLQPLRHIFPAPPERVTFVGRVVTTARLLYIADIEHDRDAPPGLVEFARANGFRSIFAAPMLRDGHTIGAIAATHRDVDGFTLKQGALLETFADQAVIAIENVRLFKELQARTAELTHSVEKLTALGEVSRAVSSTLDVETVLTTIVSRAVQLSGLDGGVVFEYDEQAEEFVHRAATEQGGALAEARRAARIRKGEGMLGRTAVTLEPAQVGDIAVAGAYESRLRENLIESGVRAILAVPMVCEGRLVGSVVVNRNRPGEFPPETIELLQTFATQSALAIQNARLFRELADKSRQLEVASRHKSEFLANMSHELRTPLNAIIGFSEVLAEGMFGEVNEKQTEYLRDILESGRHLLSLINDILDLSKIEAGRMELELTDFDLPTALDNALILVRERAGRRGIALHMRVDKRLGEVRGDERKIRQVVLNLLSNAIKFTPEGGRIEVRAVPTDGAVEVSVEDTGVGIAPEDQEAVFEEFRQVGGADKKVEGTGLGLALCRKFVELHGGRIWVTSQVGAGSTFTFTLPVRRGE